MTPGMRLWTGVWFQAVLGYRMHLGKGVMIDEYEG